MKELEICFNMINEHVYIQIKSWETMLKLY
jgi:hypothetical protein